MTGKRKLDPGASTSSAAWNNINVHGGVRRSV